ncbi:MULTISPECIES: hypothetical protein [Microbulbifer]|uniref:DNA breaking-rejoining protein n=1 Tax=Microbulbifer celer TaxID=435905 RepID=A0ABW3U9Y6_9GAMM|nr:MULTISPECIES: hypothetical protein [Microbulbifer]UFN58468.1 hypothetical protein LPW13_05340 [Microbulbifer celer]
MQSLWKFIPIPLLVAITVIAGPQNERRSERVRLAEAPSGAGAARMYDAINGYQTVEYLVDGKTGQSMQVRIASTNSHNLFRINAPAAPRAMFTSRPGGPGFSATLPRDGTYRVVVFLLRNAASEGEAARFSLDIRVSDPG